MSDPLFLIPENPSLLEFRGPDAVRYLNGQVTQNVTNIGDRALPACVTDAKGRLQFFVTIQHAPDQTSVWVAAPAEVREDLLGRLERYLIADDVEIIDLTGEWTRIHASAVPDPAPAFHRPAAGIFGEGCDLWFQASKVPDLTFLDPLAAESMRVERLIPAWGRELTPGLLPPEAGLDRNAISYAKGCYIGQEVISRLKSAGKLNRRLAGLSLSAPADAGHQLFLDGIQVGELTSVTAAKTPRALGFLSKKGFDADAFEVRDAQDRVLATATRDAWA